jgi:glutamate-ammonia-ligase adenylyltransferase
VVAGDPQLGQAFGELRRQLLFRPRARLKLRAEVVEMREKMREHLLPAGLERRQPPVFHLKHSVGAIVDIEFMVQYAVLAWAGQYPALAVYSDNIRILTALADERLVSEQQCRGLIDAYKAFRARAHRLSLLGQNSEVPAADYRELRAAVIDSWETLMT